MIVTFSPSMNPTSFRPWRNAARRLAMPSDDLLSRKPITGRVGCCARAASGHAAAPLSRVMKSRRRTCCPQNEDCTLPHGDRKYRVVHHSKFGGQCRSWVKSGKAQNEHIMSTLSPKADIAQNSLLSTHENHFGRGALSLGQERRPILLFKNQGTARAYGKRIEDTFISLARNCAGLA